MILKRYYPTTESFLKGYVSADEYYDYIRHGFIIVKTDEGDKYASCSLNSPVIWIPKTQEMDDIMSQKNENESNLSTFIKLTSRLKFIQVHNKVVTAAMIKSELDKEEFKSTVVNYKATIDYLIGRMFPTIVL